MELQKLAIDVEDERIIGYIARRTGINSVLLNGEEKDPGTVALIVRPSDDRVEKTLHAIRQASALGIPVVIIAGALDPVGETIVKEARGCGVPGECLLFVNNGKITDALGNVIGDALRGMGVGVMAVVAYADRVAQQELIPEPLLWDGSAIADTPDAVLWERGQGKGEETLAAPEDGQTAAAQPQTAVAEAAQAAPWKAYLDRAGKVVAVFGIKSGVGASTLAACLSGVLADHGSFYLEASSSATGYAYFGSSPSDASKTGKYACCTETEKDGVDAEKDIPLLIVDATIPGAMDAVYERADCVIVVTDGSPVAFGITEKWIKGGWRADILVVNRVVPGTGYPPEVYSGEFGLERVIGVPGGLEEETAINLAQRSAALPLGKSVDFDAAIGDLAEAVLKILEGGNSR